MPCPNHPDAVADMTCVGCAREFCSDCVVELGGQTLCATCKEERLRDMKSGTTGLDLASPWARFGAQLVDFLVILMPISLAIYFLDRPDPNVVPGFFDHYALRTLLPGFIWVIYEWQMLANGGQTLGKKALGLKVVAADGSDLTGQSLVRAVSREVMNLTFVLGFVDVLMVFTDQHRTLHDRIAKTAVINWKR